MCETHYYLVELISLIRQHIDYLIESGSSCEHIEEYKERETIARKNLNDHDNQCFICKNYK